MGVGTHRNGQCPCGSGKKYKKCHLEREAQSPLPFNDIVTRSKKVLSKRYCLLRANAVCKGDIVSAHTVAHSTLRLIARDGKVYVLEKSVPASIRNGGQPRFHLKGAAQCTTFSGFCQHHDKQLFAPLEDCPFSGSAQQCFLLYLRALAREQYYKHAHAESMRLVRELDRGRPVHAQVEIQQFVADHGAGIAIALRDLERWWATAMRCLSDEHFDEYRSALFYFDRRPGIACSGAIFPDFDFFGKTLQNLAKEALDFMSFTLLPLNPTKDGGEHGVAVFVWHNTCASARAFVESLTRITQSEQADAITRFVFEYHENVALNPDWWEALDEGKRQSIGARQRAAASPHTAREATCLVADGQNVAAWSVSRTEMHDDDARL